MISKGFQQDSETERNLPNLVAQLTDELAAQARPRSADNTATGGTSTTDTRSSPAAPIRATVFVGRWPNVPTEEFPGVPNGTFAPTTATLVGGATEVVLIDALYLKDDVRDLGDLIERTGKKLTTISITLITTWASDRSWSGSRRRRPWRCPTWSSP
jgi:hypothetical protein